jgi:hypothetical protein
MGLDDWILGGLTLGAYNVGKSIYNASKAAEKAGNEAGDLADQAGEVLAIASAQFSKLGSSLTSFIEELQELVTIKRATPRDESELWDEEVARLKALREKEAELLQELEALEKDDKDYSFGDIFWGSLSGAFSFDELLVQSKLAMVRAAINEILYEEPGVIPTSIYQLKESLEQFNNTTMPLLDETVGSVNNNLEESIGILQEVKKLFVIKIYEPVVIDTLPEFTRQKLRELEDKVKIFDSIINKNTLVASQLRKTIDEVSPSVSGPLRPVASVSKDIGLDKESSISIASKVKSSKNILGLSASDVKPTKMMAAKVGSILKRDEISAYITNYNAVQGGIRYFERERLKVEKEITRITFVLHEEPGVIPKTLDEVKQILQRFRTEEQPQIENIMENFNNTIIESKNMIALANANTSKIFGFITRHKLLLGIATGLFGTLIVGILLMSLIILTRNAFGL